MRFVVRLALILPLGLAALPARAEEPGPVVAAALREVVVPRYERLAAATGRQSETWHRFCAAPAEAGLPALAAAFAETADSWSAIEFVRYGPVEQDNRIDRMAHWPERQNAVGRALATLLARTGSEDLAPARFAATSVAGQGFSALERLVVPDGPATLVDGSEAARRRCAVGTAIADALAATAAAILGGWRGDASPIAKPWRPGAPEAREAATRLATELVAFLDTVADAKLGGPLGKAGPESAKPRLAEGWRTERSLRAIRINLEGVEALARALLDPRDDAATLSAIADARRLADSLPGPLGRDVEDPQRRVRVALLKDVLKGLRELVATAVTDRLGVAVGFNSRDGD